MGCQCNKTNNLITKCNVEMTDNDSIFFGGLCKPGKFLLTGANYWTELTVNGKVEVPSEKPSIEAIDSINTKIDIIRRKVVLTPAKYTSTTDDTVTVASSVNSLEGKRTTGRKLIVEGLLCFTISYVSKAIDQKVHSFHGQIPFSAYIVVPYVIGTVDSLNINYEVASCLEDIMVKEFCDRNVELCATFVLQAIPSDKACDDSYLNDSGIPCGLNLKRRMTDNCVCGDAEPVIGGLCPLGKIKSVLIDTATDTKWTEIFVPEILNIPSYKPDVEQILTVTSKVDIICQKVIATPTAGPNYEGIQLTGKKVIVEAILRQRITYVSKTECQSVHSAHFDVPLSVFIVVPSDTALTAKFKLTTCIEDIFSCALNPRQIFKNITLFIKADNIQCGK